MIEITFNRPIADGSLGTAAGPNIFVDRLDPAGGGQRLIADLKLQEPAVALYIVRDPQIFFEGDYHLTCLGGAAGQPGIRAADDQSALDGDYDGMAGGDFKMPFQVQ